MKKIALFLISFLVSSSCFALTVDLGGGGGLSTASGDANYVNVASDTMTGDLIVNTSVQSPVGSFGEVHTSTIIGASPLVIQSDNINVTPTTFGITGDVTVTGTVDGYDVSQRFELIATDTVTLQTAIDDIEVSTISVQAQLDDVATSTISLQTQLDSVSVDTTTIGSDLSTLISEVASDTTTIQSNLNTLSSDVATDTTTIQGNVNTVAGDLSSLDSAVTASTDAIQLQLDTLDTDVTASTDSLQLELDTLQSDVATDTTTIASDLSTLTSAVSVDTTTLQTNINTLDGEVASATATLQTNIDNVVPYIVIAQDGTGDVNGTDWPTVFNAAKAIWSADGETGAKIYVKRGTYTYDGASMDINDSPLIQEPGISIVGESLGAVVLNMLTITTSTFSGQLLKVGTCPFTMENMVFYSTTNYNSRLFEAQQLDEFGGFNVQIDDANMVTLVNNRFINTDEGQPSTRFNVVTLGSGRAVVSGNEFFNAGVLYINTVKAKVSSNFFTNTRIQGSFGNVISDGSVISDNTFRYTLNLQKGTANLSPGAIQLSGSDGCKIIGNYIEYSTGVTTNQLRMIRIDANTNGTVISNNYIVNRSLDATAPVAFYITGAIDSQISNNYLSGFETYLQDGGADTAFTGNFIRHDPDIESSLADYKEVKHSGTELELISSTSAIRPAVIMTNNTGASWSKYLELDGSIVVDALGGLSGDLYLSGADPSLRVSDSNDGGDIIMLYDGVTDLMDIDSAINFQADITLNSGATLDGYDVGVQFDAVATDTTTVQSNLNSHTGDATIHFTEATIDHVSILSTGTNTHAEIDSQLSTIATDTTTIASDLGTLDTNVTASTDALQLQLDTLDTDVTASTDALQLQLDTLDTDVTASTDALQLQLDTLDTDVTSSTDAIQLQLDTLDTNVTASTDALQLQLDTLDTDVTASTDAIQLQLDTLDTNVTASTDAIQLQLDTLDTDVTASTNALQNTVTALDVSTTALRVTTDALVVSTTSLQSQINSAKIVFFPVGHSNQFSSNYKGMSVATNAQGRMTMHIPHDFTSITSVKVICIPAATVSTVDLDVFVDYATFGEDAQTHTASDTTSTYNFTANQVTAIDITSLFSSLASHDVAGVQMDHNAIGTAVLYLGMEIFYQ